MSTKEYDDRIVRMGFDNAKFETNAAKTMSTLDKLNEKLKLKGASEGSSNVQKEINSIDFSSLERAIARIESRFSTMGIVGMNVINKITDGITGSVKQLEAATIGQIKSGGWNRAMNIANAKFQIEGLGFAWEEVEKAVSYGVKDTAYGLDAAASAASQLAASGVDFKETLETVNGQDLTAMHKSLRAISGVAAMTNSSYEDIARIFTTVAGNGRLMGDQLLQLSSRGMNAAAKLAEVMNTTEEAVRDMVSHGQIDFKTFAFAMDDAFGDHAKEANKTFTGALGNMKAALSRVGEIFASPIINKTNTLFISLTARIDEFKNKLKSIQVPRTLEEIKKQYGDISMNAAAYDAILKSMGERTVTFGDHFAEMWQSGIDAFSAMTKAIDISWFDKVVEKVDSVTVKIKDFFDLIKEIYSDSAEEAADGIKDATETLLVSAEEAQAAKDIILKGMYGSGQQRVDALTEMFGGGDIGKQHAKNVQAYVDSVVSAGWDFDKASIKVEDAADRIVDAQEETEREAKKAKIKAIIDDITGTLSNLWKVAKNLGSAAIKIITPILNAFGSVFKIDFGSITGGISSFSETLVKLSEKLIIGDDTAKKIEDTFTKFFGTVQKGLGYVEKGIELFKKFATSIAESETVSSFGEVLTGLYDTIKSFLTFDEGKGKDNPIVTFVSGIVESIDKLVSGEGDAPSLLTTFINDIIDSVKKVNWKDVAKIGGAAFAVYNIIKLVFAIKSLGGIVMSIANIPAAISGFFTRTGKAIEGASAAYGLASAAKAIGIVAASILVLSKIPEDDLYRGMAAIIIIVGILKYLMKAANNIKQAETSFKGLVSSVKSAVATVKTMYALAGVIAAFAAAVTIMSVGLAIIAKSDAADGASFLTLIGIMSALVLVIYAVTKIATKMDAKAMLKMPAIMSSMSIMFAAVGAAVLMMSTALWIISRIPTDAFGMVITLLGAMFLGMALITKMATDAKSSRLLAAAATISAIGVAMSLIIISVGGACALIASAMSILDATGTNPEDYLLSFIGIVSAIFLAVTGLTELAKNVKNFATVAVTLLAMSVTMNAIGTAAILVATALSIISASVGEDISSALSVLGMIFGSFIILMYMSTAVKPTQMLASAVMFVGVAGAVLVLSAAIALLSRLGSDKMLEAAGSIVVALIGLGIAITIASTSLGKAKNSAGLVIGGVLAMSVAIAIIAASIAKIGDTNHLLGATLALGGVLLAIAGVLAILTLVGKKSEGSGDTLLSVGAAFIMISASLLILAYAIEKMSAILNNGGVVGAIAIMAGFLVIVGGLAIAAALIPGAALAFEAVGKAFLYAGIGAALVGVGILAVCAGIKMLAPAIGVLAISLEMFFTTLENHKAAAIAVGVVAMVIIAGIIIAIMKLAPVIEAIAETISAVANRIGGTLSSGQSKLKDWMSNLSTKGKATIAALITTLCGAILKASPEVLKTAGQLIIKLLSYLGSIAGSVARGLLEFVINLINGLAEAIMSHRNRISAALTNVIAAILGLAISILGDFLSWIPGVKKALEGVNDEIAVQMMERKKLAEEADKTTDEYIDAVNDAADATEESVKKSTGLFDGLTNAFSKSSKEQKDELASLKKEYKDLPGYAYDAILRSKNPGMFNSSGKTDAESYTDGYDSVIDDYMHGGGGASWDDYTGEGVINPDIDLENIETYTSTNAEAVAEGSDEMYDASDDMMGGAQDAIVDNKDETKKNIQENFNDPAQAQVRGSRPGMYNATKYVVEGAIEALEDGKKGYCSAMVKLAKAGQKSFETQEEIESPSKVFFQNGEYIVEGLVNGIVQSTDGVTSTMGGLSNAILLAFGNPFEYLSKISSGELVYDPSVRPVFDGSGLYKGASSIDSMLSQQTITVSGLSGKLAADIGTLDNTNTEVVNELRALREEMSYMQDAISDMQVVMDTGELVGVMSSPMDTALGRRAAFKQRGN